MTEPPGQELDVVAEGVFYALFRVVEIEELSGPEKAVEWARSVVEDADLRLAFANRVREVARDRAQGRGQSPIRLVDPDA